MRRAAFLRDALAFAAGGALLFGAAFAVSEAVDPVYPEVRQRMALLHRVRDSVEVVAAGNSHVRAVDFGALGMRGFHLWRGGGDVFEAAYTVRHAAPALPRLRYVLVSVSYPSLRTDNADAGARDVTVRRREMYAMPSAVRWIPGDARHFVAGKTAPVVRPDHWGGVAFRLLGKPATAVSIAPDGRLPEPPWPVLSPDALAGQAARRAAEGGGVASAGSAAVVARSAAELDALARELGKRGVWTVFYTPPYFHAYNEAFDPGVVREMRDTMVALDRRHPRAVWLDYAADPAFTHRPELFQDGDHLNPDGSRAFTAVLGRCLRALPRRTDACGRPPDTPAPPPLPTPR